MTSHGIRQFGLMALIALSTVSGARANEVTLTAKTAIEAVDQGKAFETRGDWIRAIQHYDAALEKWKKNPELTYAQRRSRVCFSIDRRYTDRSFETTLLGQSEQRAIAMFEEVLSTVREYYVDGKFRTTSFIAHGTESLYMALSQQTKFRPRNVTYQDDVKIQAFRQRLLNDYWNKPVRHQMEARDVVLEIAELANRELGIPRTAVIMEYTCGGCNSLDDYSNFLTPDRLDELYGNIDGEFVGIGIEMESLEERGQHLVNVLPDSPASRGGLQPDDFIVEIDGIDCRDMTTDEAAQLLKGKPNTIVRLTIETPAKELRVARLTRRPVMVKSITRAEIVDSEQKVGYIRMEGFQKSTTNELDRALSKLEAQGMRALIWDLRGNPGGLLDTAAGVLDRFVDGGTLVSTRGRTPDQNQVFSATGFHTHNVPLVLLVDGDSASASEIVAGAVLEHRRGTIVGRKTYGKWSVQSILPLSNGTGMRLTTAKFYSPEGRNLSKVGVRPHVAVKRTDDPTKRRSYFRNDARLQDDPDISRGLQELSARLSQLP
ncbi:MAG: S41 family peptidase [Planctomycetaceae bacterium]